MEFLDWRAISLFIHLASTLAMAAPLYMLVVVGERGRLGLPPNYNTDRYMENIIGRNAVRCFVFQGTMALSGLALVPLSGRLWSALWTSPDLIVKWVALLILVSLLSYVHFSLQPRIEALINQLRPDEPSPPDLVPKLGSLRLRRKRLSALCLFFVLTALTMGLRVTFGYNYYLAIAFVGLGGLWAWRVYRQPVPLGWF